MPESVNPLRFNHRFMNVLMSVLLIQDLFKQFSLLL